MGSKLFISIITLTSALCQARSPTSTIFKMCTGDFSNTNIVEDYYFPEVEYPLEVLDVIKPFFFRASTSILEPFPKEVRDSFASIASKTAKESPVNTKYVDTCNINDNVQVPKPTDTSCAQNTTSSVNSESSKPILMDSEENNIFNNIENDPSEYVTAAYASYECEELYKVDGIKIISEDD